MPFPFLYHNNCAICDKNKELKDLLSSTKPNISRMFGHNVSSCAVVSGDPALKSYSYGSLIDSFPVVMKLNLRNTTPTKSYGHKATHMFVNDALWNAHDRIYHKFNDVTKAPGIVIFNHFGTDWKLHNPWTHGEHSILRKIVEFLNSRKSKLDTTLVLDPIFSKACFTAYETAAQKKVKYTPSTGFMALVLMSRLCASVHAFGFTEPSKNGWHPVHEEHMIYHTWLDDKHADVKLFLYPPHNHKP